MLALVARMKAFTASLFALLLAGPALADPNTKAPPRTATSPVVAQPAMVLPTVQSVRLSVAVKSGADVRTHELVISERGCGSIKDRSASYEDEVRICSTVMAKGLMLELDGSTRAGMNEYRTRSEVLLARSGAVIEVGRAGGVRYVLKTL